MASSESNFLSNEDSLDSDSTLIIDNSSTLCVPDISDADSAVPPLSRTDSVFVSLHNIIFNTLYSSK